MKHILILAALGLLQSALGSHLSILEPEALKNEFYDRKNMIDNNLASFGYIPYGSYLLGRAYFQKDNNKGCNEFAAFDTRGDPDDIFTPIFVVERGVCTFVQKARRAQNAGAKLLIITDNMIESVNSILLSDDGTGRDITIPTMLVDFETGGRLYKYLNKDQDKEANWVTLRAVFDTWQSEKVNYDIYFAGSQLYFYRFLHDMKDFHFLLDKTTVRPHFRVHSYTEGSIPKSSDCYADGKYCIFTDIPATGRQILTEHLRQICILNRNVDFVSSKDSATRIYDSESWFRYVSEYFNHNCDGSNEGCSYNAMSRAGINSGAVQRCVENAVERDSLTKDETIPFFDYQIQDWNRTWNTVMYPAITINRMYYKGNLIAEEVFRMICASYETQPQGCVDYYRPPEEPKQEQTGLTVGAIIGIVILILIINVIVIVCYRRYAKRDEQDRLKTEVNSAVSAYFALNEQEKS